MRAIIVGGGIGGPVAAAALQRAGIESIVYEAHDGPADGRGLFLTLGVNGMRVLRSLDLLDAVMRTDVIPTPRMVFTSWTGKRLGEVSNGWLDERTPSITIMRGTMQRALADAVRARGIEIRYGKRFVDQEEMGGRRVARFDDGSEAEYDILIGADGIRSRVRSVALPDAPAPRYTGLLNLGGFVPRTELESTPDTMHMVWGRRAFFGYTVRPTGETWWFANVGERREPGRDELTSVTTAEWKARLRALFADDPPFIGETIEATPVIGAFPIHDMPSLERWSCGRAVLLGDAAHAVSPSAGQGASMAMEDALVLAICLRDIAGPERALERYEALRRPRAEKVVAEGRRRGAYKAPESRIAVFLRDLLMPVGFRLFATDRAMAWIRDYEIPWERAIA